MRIIGGTLGRRRLAAPKGLSVRPTPDLVRQAVFNSLGPVFDGVTVLDLFSGTGALGLECASRGARLVVSVELSSRHAAYIRENSRLLDVDTDRHEVWVHEAFAAIRHLCAARRQFDFAFADPPFGPKTKDGQCSASLSQRLLDEEGLRVLLRPGGRLVLGHARRDHINVPSSWHEVRSLSHGDSMFRILAVASDDPSTTKAAVAD